MLLLSARVRHQTYPVITGQDEAEALRAITTVSRHGAGISVGVAVLHLNDSGHSLPAFEIRKRMFRFVNGLFYYFSICFRDCGRWLPKSHDFTINFELVILNNFCFGNNSILWLQTKVITNALISKLRQVLIKGIALTRLLLMQ